MEYTLASTVNSTSTRTLALYWAAVASVALLAAPLAPRAAAMAPPCLFRAITGLPCPTCGATHAVVALSHLDVAGALVANPLVTLAGLAFMVGGLVGGAAALLGRPFAEPRLGQRARVALIAALGANWIWLLAGQFAR